MGLTIKNIILLFTLMLAGLFLPSCIMEYGDDGAPETAGAEELTLRIKAITTAQASQNHVEEKLKSLRIVMIDDGSGLLQINEKVDLPLEEYEAKDFLYTYKAQITSGHKKVYLIGNEESVGPVALTEPDKAPKEMPLTSLTRMLDFFTPDSDEGGATATGGVMETVLNSVYFENPQLDPDDGDAVYLPYSSFYELEVGYHSKVTTSMYLVPAAAKFDLVITNFRQTNARIDDVILNGFNSHNFLNAQLDDIEKTRKINGEDYWWVDWLRVCSEESQKDPDRNESFNAVWGWISKYHLPLPEEPTTLKRLNPDNELWVIPKLTNMLNPSRLFLGPYYVPESINVIPAGDGSGATSAGSQAYLMTIKLRDEDAQEVVTLADNHIDTAKALFRGTHVVVYVELYESKVDIYSEVARWKDWGAQGFVQEADD